MRTKTSARQSVPKTEIARRCGVSRQTVYNHLNRESSASKPRKSRPSKLDPYKEYLRSRLEEYDLPATVLYREIRARGEEGKLTFLRDFVRPLKKELTRRVVACFETRPGHQAQIDWGECGMITLGGERKRLYLFTPVLGYSRMTYARFTTSPRLPALLDCLQRAFGELGVPEEILVDNMKQAVDQHDTGTGSVRWNRTFLDFAEHHGFVPAATRPYWPQAKGKVERDIGYVNRGFLEGRSLSGLDGLNAQLVGWLDSVANVCVHGTTGERPVELRVVHRDSHIRYQSFDYSVHPEALGRTVAVRPEGEAIGSWFSVFPAKTGWAVTAAGRREPVGSPSPGIGPLIQELTWGSSETAHRRHGRQPRFVQEATAEEAAATLQRIHRSAPSVDFNPLRSASSWPGRRPDERRGGLRGSAASWMNSSARRPWRSWRRARGRNGSRSRSSKNSSPGSSRPASSDEWRRISSAPACRLRSGSRTCSMRSRTTPRSHRGASGGRST